MTVHLTMNGYRTCCGWRLGEVAAESYTTDPEQVDCPDCSEHLSETQYEDDIGYNTGYNTGYGDGKSKAFFEMEHWQPNEHFPGCGCRPCVVARSVIVKVLGQQSEE